MKFIFFRFILYFHTFLERLYMKAYIVVCKSQGMKIGKGVKIFGRVNFGSEPYLIEIGEKTQIANGVSFVNHGGTTKTIRRLSGFENVRIFGRIKVGRNCTIGSNCIIQQNVEIGDNCILEPVQYLHIQCQVILSFLETPLDSFVQQSNMQNQF